MSPSSQSGFQIVDFGIRYTEGRSQIASGLCLVAALVALAALWGMIAAFSWQPLRLALLWPTLTALTFAAFATLMLSLALAPPQVLTFDAAGRRLRGRARRHLGLSRRLEPDFMALHLPKVQSFTQESGDTFHQVHICIAHQPPILMGAFSERQEAQYWCDRLAELVAPGSSGGAGLGRPSPGR